MTVLIAGFLLGLSLIVAIGPQNAYLIKMGIQRNHVLAVAMACLLSDVLLIFGGVAGMGEIVERFPTGLLIIKYLGAAYLLHFAYTCFRDAFAKNQEALVVDTNAEDPSDQLPSAAVSYGATTGTPAHGGAVKTRPAPARPVSNISSLRAQSWVKPVLGALALTWLNPLAYIDAMVMVGGIASNYGQDGRWIFGLGALLASTLWFPSVGLGAARLSSTLAKPQTWRLINIAVGFIMIVLVVKLLTS